MPWTDAGRSGIFAAGATTSPQPQLYTALFSTSADPSGSPIELVLAGYARQPTIFGLTAVDNAASLYDVRFGPLAAGAYLGVGVFDDPLAGDLWYWNDESASIPIGASTTVDFPAGQITLQRV